MACYELDQWSSCTANSSHQASVEEIGAIADLCFNGLAVRPSLRTELNGNVTSIEAGFQWPSCTANSSHAKDGVR